MLCSKNKFDDMKNLNIDTVKNKINDLFDTKLKKNQILQKEDAEITAKKNFSFAKKSNECNQQFNINLTNEKTENFCLSLPYQLKRKIKSKSFTFTLMIVGESGLGKSTLVNQLFNCDIYNPNNPGPSFKPCKTKKIDVNTIHLVENQINLFLNLIDTPGFGNYLDNSSSCLEIFDYVEKKFNEYLINELQFSSDKITDNRIHCCLYFIQPSGHRLKPIDIEIMSKLCKKINLVPIIAKADSLTHDELLDFKKNILEDLTKNNIKIYDFPDYNQINLTSSQDQAKIHKYYKSLLPFAIISSNYTYVDINGNKKRLRKYIWGEIDVENLEFSDFIAMKKLIIECHLLDMIEKTNVYYENYRTQKLETIEDGTTKKKSHFYQRTLTNTLMVFWNPLWQIEEEKKEYELKIEKMREDMESVFKAKVAKKKKHLEEIKAELKKHEDEMEEHLKEANQQFEKEKLQFEKEKEAFELLKKDLDTMKINNELAVKDLGSKDNKRKEKQNCFKF